MLLSVDEEFGNATAFKIKDAGEVKEISYHRFVTDVQELQGWMLNNHYAGKYIGIISKNCYEWIVWYFAIIMSGAVAVPINRAFPKEAVEELVERFDIYALIYDKEEIEWMEELIKYRNLIAHEIKSLHKTSLREPNIEIDPDATACIFLTSGTTGISKGVMLSQKNILSAYQEREREDYMTVLLVLPFHHIAGAECIFDILVRGNAGAINDSVKHIVNDMMFFNPYEICVVPGIAEFLAKLIRSTQGKAINPNLSRLISCGAALQVSCQNIFKEHGIDLWQIYGMTETSGIVTLCDKDLRQGVVGEVQKWNNVEIELGEIKIKGSNVMSGYYKDPIATQEVLRDGWLYTGDLGFVDEAGLLHINGRKKNLIILSNGENVSPEELEFILESCSRVQEVLVKAEDDRICAEIYTVQAEHISPDAIQKEVSNFIRDINRNLPTFRQIRKIIFRENEFEKTAVGKIKRWN